MHWKITFPWELGAGPTSTIFRENPLLKTGQKSGFPNERLCALRQTKLLLVGQSLTLPWDTEQPQQGRLLTEGSCAEAPCTAELLPGHSTARRAPKPPLPTQVLHVAEPFPHSSPLTLLLEHPKAGAVPSSEAEAKQQLRSPDGPSWPRGARCSFQKHESTGISGCGDRTDFQELLLLRIALLVVVIAAVPTVTPALPSCTLRMSHTAPLTTALPSPGNSCERKFLSLNNKNRAVGGGMIVTGENQMYGDPGCPQTSHNSSS